MITEILFIMQVVFIILKLISVVSWSWWTVFSPFFIFIGILAFLVLVGFFQGTGSSLSKKLKDKDYTDLWK